MLFYYYFILFYFVEGAREAAIFKMVTEVFVKAVLVFVLLLLYAWLWFWNVYLFGNTEA